MLRHKIATGISTLLFALAAIQRGQAGELVLTHPYPEHHRVAEWAQGFAACAAQAAGVSINVVPDAKYGYAEEIARATAEGLVDFSIVPAWALQKLWPEAAGLDQPGQVLDPMDLLKLSADLEFLKWISNRATELPNYPGERRGTMALLSIAWEFDSLIGTESSLQNLKGKKLLIYGIEEEALLTTFGATGADVSYDDIVPAMKHGAIDAAVVETEVALEVFSQARLKNCNGLRTSSHFTTHCWF